MPKKTRTVFHNKSNYDYHGIIKELAEEFKKQFTGLLEKYWKIYNLYIFNRTRNYKNWGEIATNISYILQLLIAHYLWQAHYQILSTIFLKEFTKLNVKTDMKMKIVKLAELDKIIAAVFLNIQTLKMI